MGTLAEKNRWIRCEELKSKLVEWMWSRYHRKVFVSDSLLKSKAEQFQTSLNSKLKDHEQIQLKFSKFWLLKFKRRKKFKTYRSQGEGGDANMIAIEQQIPLFIENLSQYSINDVCNADEIGLFYSMAPDTTIGSSKLPDRKK